MFVLRSQVLLHFPLTKFQTIVTLISAPEAIFILLSRTPRRRTPLQPEESTLHVRTFFATIAIYYSRHPYRIKACKEWISRWIYPVLEFTRTQHVRSPLCVPYSFYGLAVYIHFQIY
jgi:hypothetical protein